MFRSIFLLSILLASNLGFAAKKTIEPNLNDLKIFPSSSGVSFDLIFSKPYSAKNLSIAKERNFIQAVAKNAKMNSGKTLNLNNSEVAKIFAYPFNKNTSRIRIFSKTTLPPEGKVTVWNTTPQVVRLFIKKDQPSMGNVQTVSAAANEADTRDATLAEVLAKTPEVDVNNPASVAALKPEKKSEESIGISKSNELAVSSIDKQDTKSIGTKADPTRHFLRMFAVLGGILALFGAIVWLMKRYSNKLNKLPFGKKERLIQVVATHYLGNKKSIALVKVTGEYMVVGVSNENISLISKIGAENAVDKFLEERFWNGTFEKHLTSYSKDPNSEKLVDLSEDTKDIRENKSLFANYDGPRDFNPKDLGNEAAQTRDRVEISREASQVRSGILEKITHLKPLN